MDLGSYLNQVRTERGYSLRDVADRSGVSATEISRIETGKRLKPSPDVLRPIAEALLVSYPYLLQLAGYLDESAREKEPKETQAVFRDETTGEIVDASSGAQEMLQTDAGWANVAYRVSKKLSDEDRKMLQVLAEQYLKRVEEKLPWDS